MSDTNQDLLAAVQQHIKECAHSTTACELDKATSMPLTPMVQQESTDLGRA